MERFENAFLRAAGAPSASKLTRTTKLFKRINLVYGERPKMGKQRINLERQLLPAITSRRRLCGGMETVEHSS